MYSYGRESCCAMDRSLCFRVGDLWDRGRGILHEVVESEGREGNVVFEFGITDREGGE
jgi:hypothetical protein